MNEPIISPWIIYWISMVSNLGIAVMVLCIVFGIAGFIMLMIYGIELGDDLFQYKKYIISWLIFMLMCALLMVATPNKDTMYAMLIAKQATPANIAKAKELGKDFKDMVKQDIIDVIKQINKEDVKK